MKRTIILAISFLCGAYVWQGCHSTAKEESKKAADAPAPIDTFTLTPQSLTSSIKMPGELIAYQQVDLYGKVSSFIKKLYADVGSEVQTGQLLATLEAPELSSQLLGAESRLKAQEATYLSSKATYDRLLATSKTPGTVSQNDLDVAFAKQNADKAGLEAARAAQGEIKDTRNYLEIRAPFSGVISARNVSAGAYVGPAGKGSDLPIFTLQEQKKLRLVVSIPEAYTSYLKKGSEVQFTVGSFPGEVFSAKVVRLAGALDSRLRSQHTEMDVDNNDQRLLPGTVAEVQIPLVGRPKAFIVPNTAILNSTTGVFVIKVDNHKAKWIPVRTGNSSGGKTEIYGKVVEGDVLLTTVNEELRDGEELIITSK
ncbi:RND family efflux transporter, MFP subunit [bacterium A37T11]|nr:RND family efflux transporter, MFP subunit [bacterium A37T11]